jgi:hypothetical protein
VRISSTIDNMPFALEETLPAMQSYSRERNAWSSAESDTVRAS